MWGSMALMRRSTSTCSTATPDGGGWSAATSPAAHAQKTMAPAMRPGAGLRRVSGEIMARRLRQRSPLAEHADHVALVQVEHDSRRVAAAVHDEDRRERDRGRLAVRRFETPLEVRPDERVPVGQRRLLEPDERRVLTAGRLEQLLALRNHPLEVGRTDDLGALGAGDHHLCGVHGRETFGVGGRAERLEAIEEGTEALCRGVLT